MSDDEDADGRRRDRFQSERKRSNNDERDAPHHDTPRPGPSKRGRYDSDRPPPQYGRDDRGSRRGGLMSVPDRSGRGPHGPPMNRGPPPRGRHPRGPPLLADPGRGPGHMGRGRPHGGRGHPGPLLPTVAGTPVLPPRRPFKYSIKSLAEWSKTNAVKPEESDDGESEGEKMEMASAYFKFKLKATIAQAERIFFAHEGELWFREQYFGGAYERLRSSRRDTVRRRCDAFMPFVEDERLEGLNLPFPLTSRAGDTLGKVLREIEDKLLESHPAEICQGELDTADKDDGSSSPATRDGAPVIGTAETASVGAAGSAVTTSAKPRTADEEEAALLGLDYSEDPVADDGTDDAPTEETTEVKQAPPPEDVAARRKLAEGARRSFAVKLILTVELTTSELAKTLRKISGFHKLAVAYPSELSRLDPGQRLMWATFTGVKVDVTMRSLRRMVIDGDPVLAHTQLESPSPNPLRMAVADRAIRVEDGDEKLAHQLIESLDKFEGLWVGEGEINPVLATNSLLKMLLYLRTTHSLDFYAGLQWLHEDGMAQPLPYLTLPTTLTRVNARFSDECRDRLSGIVEALNECRDFEVDSLVRTQESASEDFIAKNTVALPDGTFQCPLSGKRFRGPEFVRTHILNKHDAILKKYLASVAQMKPYLEDPYRIRILPLAMGGGRGAPIKDQFGRDVPVGRVMPPHALRSPPMGGGPGMVRTLRRYDNL